MNYSPFGLACTTCLHFASKNFFFLYDVELSGKYVSYPLIWWEADKGDLFYL